MDTFTIRWQLDGDGIFTRVDRIQARDAAVAMATLERGIVRKGLADVDTVASIRYQSIRIEPAN